MGGRRLSPSTSMAQVDPGRSPASSPEDGSTHDWARYRSRFSSGPVLVPINPPPPLLFWRALPIWAPLKKAPPRRSWEPPASRLQGPGGPHAGPRGGTWPKFSILALLRCWLSIPWRCVGWPLPPTLDCPALPCPGPAYCPLCLRTLRTILKERRKP